MNYKSIIFLLFFQALLKLNLYGQVKKMWSKYSSLSRPEKTWVLAHPFVSKKAYLLTNLTTETVDDLKNKNIIGRDESGGKLDAFKHTFWMALLSQKINHKKVNKLGKAHEKGNYLGFKRGKMEDNNCSDQVSSEMDLWNNAIGIRIGSANKNLEIKELEKLVLKSLHDGELMIIKKDNNGNYLNTSDSVIKSENLCKSWKNDKTLVKSNLTFKITP